MQVLDNFRRCDEVVAGFKHTKIRKIERVEERHLVAALVKHHRKRRSGTAAEI